ncbi:LysE family translocator [Pseudomonas sp.]|uniref:LysE family translocator n=1 Tax=Pseudomonas sp. TaxID=306 RepID=UPI003D0DD596
MPTFEYLLTCLVVVLIPGAGVIYTISTALVHGRRAGILAALACTLGILPHLLATIFGIAAILHSSALVFEALRYAGVAYLLYLAYATWRDRSALAMDGAGAPLSAGSLVVKALLVNLLNPKLTIFFLAFLPQFIRPGTGNELAQLLGLSATFMLMTFIIFTLYGFLAHAFRKAVIESERVQAWLRRGFAASFAGLGANLALADR